MKNLFNLIKYQNSAKTGDFNGPQSCLSIYEQKEYLAKYYDVFKKEYSFTDIDKVCSDYEIDELLKQIPQENFAFRKRTYINKGTYSLINLQEYKRITLFTNKTKIKEHTIHLEESISMPLPAIEIENEIGINNIEFSIKMDKRIKLEKIGNIVTMTPSRNIEFKNGIDEIIKVSLYFDGSICVKTIEDDKYHHKIINLGKYDLSKINHFSFSFNEKDILLYINENKFALPYSVHTKPNIIFFGSGLHARFAWDVTIDKCIDVNNNEIDLWEKKNPVSIKEGVLTALPLRIAAYTNRHLSTVFKTAFNINSDKDILLTINELGPSGTVYINEKLVTRVDDLCAKTIDITDFIKQGSNDLRIIIDPQAPENVASWHRHDDPYFASYLDSIYFEEVSDNYIENVAIKTIDINNKISFLSKITTKKDCAIELEIKDLDGHTIPSSTTNNITIFSGTPWSDKNPKLYRLIYYLLENDKIVDEYEVITGFRIIKQKDGALYLNDKPFIIKGALSMQYMAPLDEILLSHVYPKDSQIAFQLLALKKMHGNCLRMHQLGYGSNDTRFTRLCDYLGITLIWTTKYIDAAYGIIFDPCFKQGKYYIKQIKEVINAPSIIMYEGANEYGLFKKQIDMVYEAFVNTIKPIDDTRLICPISHLYYANDSYNQGYEYYQDNGLEDGYFKATKASFAWNDHLVVRSAHTYSWLLGYGSTWDKLRLQPWSGQKNLLKSHAHAYVVSEFAIIGHQNPSLNQTNCNDSYELDDETILGYDFSSNYQLSQAYQALCATASIAKMLSLGVDGLLWCALMGGANNGTYLKPIIDFNGHPKLAYLAIKNNFSDNLVLFKETDIVFKNKQKLTPVVITDVDYLSHQICITIKDLDNNIVFQHQETIIFDALLKTLNPILIPHLKDGYYKIYTEINEVNL